MMKGHLLVFLLIILSALGCGYKSKSDYLEHINTITIPLVTVEDPDVELNFDQRLTTALRTKFTSKWREGGDAILTLTVKDYHIVAIDFDANNQPVRLRMFLKIDYTFKDNKKNKIVHSKQDYIQSHDYFKISGMGEEPETTEVATEKIIEELCDSLYGRLAEQW